MMYKMFDFYQCIYHTWTKRKKHKSMCKTFMFVLASTTQPKARKKLWNWSFCGSLCGSPSASLMPGSFAGPEKLFWALGTCCAIQWFQHRGHFQVNSYWYLLETIRSHIYSNIYSNIIKRQDGEEAKHCYLKCCRETHSGHRKCKRVSSPRQPSTVSA